MPARMQLPDDDRTAQALSFGSVADVYERSRPQYPPDSVAWSAGSPPRRVLDLAAGTGKLTRALVTAGHDVVAVEPSTDMLVQLRSVLPGTNARQGTAEHIPLPDASVDRVLVGQAFHWFDPTVAVPEIARVLRPGGRLSLVWNLRDERVPWVAELSELIGSEETGGEAKPSDRLLTGGLFIGLATATFEHQQRLSRDGLIGLVASRSYVVTMPPDQRIRLLDEVAYLFDRTAVGGRIDLPYRTRCFRAERADRR